MRGQHNGKNKRYNNFSGEQLLAGVSQQGMAVLLCHAVPCGSDGHGDVDEDGRGVVKVEMNAVMVLTVIEKNADADADADADVDKDGGVGSAGGSMGGVLMRSPVSRIAATASVLVRGGLLLLGVCGCRRSSIVAGWRWCGVRRGRNSVPTGRGAVIV